MNRTSLVPTLAGLLISCPLLASAQDAVVDDSGISKFGDIVEMTKENVTVDSRDGKLVFPVNQIQKVTYSGEPSGLRRGRDLIGRDQLEEARSVLAKVSTEGIGRDEIRQDIQFYRAFCDGQLALTGGGDKVAAVKLLRSFQENAENQNNYHYYAAVELIGDLAVALGNDDAATKYYGILEKTPWPEYQMRSSVNLARAMVAKGQFQQAQQKYDAVLASPRDDPKARQQKLMAQIGNAICLGGLGKPDEGITILERIINGNDSRANPLLFARVYNALGTCYLGADKPKDALLAFLHVDLLFGQNGEAHAEALYHLSTLWRKVNRSDRALEARGLLQTRYGGSPWAKRLDEGATGG